MRRFWIDFCLIALGIVSATILGMVFTDLWYRGHRLYRMLLLSVPLLLFILYGIRRFRARKYYAVEAILKKHLSPRRHPLPVSIIASNLLSRTLAHVLATGEWVRLGSYLDLIRDSLMIDDVREVVATSLIHPNTWIEGDLGSGYRLYLDEQVRLKKLNPEFKLTRIFILDHGDLPDNPDDDQLVKLHVQNQFRLLICDKDVIRNIAPEFARDFIWFKTGRAQWLIDAGTELNQEERGWAFVNIVDDVAVLSSFYVDLLRALEDHCVYKSA